MAYNDFFYTSSQIYNSHGPPQVPYRVANNRGESGNGAYASALTPKAHSSYSGTTLPAGIGSTSARYLDFGSGTATTSDRLWIGGCFVSASADQTGLYPTTSSMISDDIFIAESLRAFVRIDGAAVSRGGVTIGLVTRAMSRSQAYLDTNASGQHNYNGDETSQHSTNSNAMQWRTRPTVMGGYCLTLSTTKKLGNYPEKGGSGGAGINGVPKMRVQAIGVHQNDTDYNEDEDVLQKESSNTFAFGTWYHIRMDTIPSLGGDILKVYTAPVTGAGSAAVEGIGSETWTEDTSLSCAIPASAPWYRFPGGNHTGMNDNTQSRLHQWSGWWSGANAYGSSGTYTDFGAVSIDRFQMLREIVTS